MAVFVYHWFMMVDDSLNELELAADMDGFLGHYQDPQCAFSEHSIAFVHNWWYPLTNQ